MTDYVNGIDASEWQGSSFPWDNVEIDGNRFAIIRAGVCTSAGQTYEDKYWSKNIVEARKTDLLLGAYWYMHSTASPEAQANKFVSILKKSQGETLALGWWLDVEEDTITFDMVSRFYQCFFGQWPYYPLAWKAHWPDAQLGIYTSQYMWSKVAGAEGVDLSWLPLWVADWGENREEPRLPSSWKEWAIWQYTSAGSVSGYSGNVDMNYANPAFVTPPPPTAGDDTLAEAERELRKAKIALTTALALLVAFQGGD